MAALFISSCANQSVSRSNLTISKVVSEDLYTMFPGTLRVTSQYFLLQNPFNRSAFLQIYDRQTGKELLSTGSIGNGPGEWNNPGLSNVINDKIAVYDANLKQFLFTEVDTMINISNPGLFQKKDSDFYQFVFLSESHYVVASWNETHPFVMYYEGKSFPCGQYPFKRSILNAIDRFQGNIQIHPEKELLVYATFQNPYVALYRIGKSEMQLIWENQFKPHQYSIIENQLQWGPNQPDGVSDVALTKNYIVCLVKDFKSEARGRDVAASPKAVYVFDYDGVLVHILDLPVHSIRLASDVETDIFYSVALEPDYSIVEYDLSTVRLIGK